MDRARRPYGDRAGAWRRGDPIGSHAPEPDFGGRTSDAPEMRGETFASGLISTRPSLRPVAVQPRSSAARA